MEFSRANNGGTVTDEFGVTYSEDGGILLKADPNVFREKVYAIPASTKIIWEWAFSEITSLEKVIFEDIYGNTGLKFVGEFAFEGCTSLREIEIPDSVTQMGQCIFRGCKALQKAHLPKGIASIPCECFLECASLEEVNIPEGVRCIEICAFTGNKSLRHINLPESLEWIEDTAFSGCGLESIVLPENVQFLGEDCFRDCPLNEFTIPRNVEKILPWVVSRHDGFQGVKCLSPHFKVVGDALIDEKGGLLCCWADTQEYKVPDCVKSLHGFANDRVVTIVCDHHLEEVSYDCFCACSSLQEVRLASVDNIDRTAFYGCVPTLIVGGIETPLN